MHRSVELNESCEESSSDEIVHGLIRPLVSCVCILYWNKVLRVLAHFPLSQIELVEEVLDLWENKVDFFAINGVDLSSVLEHVR